MLLICECGSACLILSTFDTSTCLPENVIERASVHVSKHFLSRFVCTHGQFWRLEGSWRTVTGHATPMFRYVQLQRLVFERPCNMYENSLSVWSSGRPLPRWCSQRQREDPYGSPLPQSHFPANLLLVSVGESFYQIDLKPKLGQVTNSMFLPLFPAGSARGTFASGCFSHCGTPPPPRGAVFLHFFFFFYI